MSVYFVAIEGPQKGKKFRIFDGAMIGRSEGDVVLNDPQVSSRHAKVRKNDRGQLVLNDLGSRNGLKVDGKSVPKVVLVPDVVIKVGGTVLQVNEPDESTFVGDEPPLPADENTQPPISPPTFPDIMATSTRPFDPNVDLQPPDWPDYFETFTNEWAPKVRNKKTRLTPMIPALELEFVRGVQNQTIWTLGYGPRKVGSNSFDLTLLEPEAPAECFKVQSGKGGVEFSTEYPQRVLLNQRAIPSELLKDGDIISIGETHIRVKFIK